MLKNISGLEYDDLKYQFKGTNLKRVVTRAMQSYNDLNVTRKGTIGTNLTSDQLFNVFSPRATKRTPEVTIKAQGSYIPGIGT